MEKSVINLSNKSLSVNHLYALYLGASFSPTPKLPNIMKFNDDLNCWFNKLRYTYNFSKFRDKLDTNNSTPDLPSSSVETTHLERCLIKHQANPNIETKATNSPALELFIQKIKEEVGNFKHSYKKHLPSNPVAKSFQLHSYLILYLEFVCDQGRVKAQILKKVFVIVHLIILQHSIVSIL